jgi:hypothetical protein
MTRLSKNRSSMTAALLDSPRASFNNVNANSDNSKPKGKFSINNLLFARLNLQKDQHRDGKSLFNRD